MADPTNLILMVIHISVAAVAFAVTLTMGGAVRRASDASREVKLAITNLAARAGLIASIFGALTLLSGLALIFYRGGFAVISPTIHVALTLVLVMLAIGQLVQRPATDRLKAAATDDDAAGWASARKRLAMSEGIQQLLWLVVLVLMFIKRG